MGGDVQAFTGNAVQSDREQSQMSPDAERICFELDREVVLSQIDSLHRAIEENSDELAMVAHEGVFEKTVSDKLSRAARSLRTMSQELAGLRSRVAKTNCYPNGTRAKP